MMGAGCNVWSVALSNMLAVTNPCWQPDATSPPLYHTSVNIPVLIYLEAHIYFSLCQNTKLELAWKAALDVLQLLLAPRTHHKRGQLTLGSAFPVMVLSNSCRCSQLPWEYQPGLSSDGSPSLSSTSFTEGPGGRISRNTSTTQP